MLHLQDGTEVVVKEVLAGDSVHSLLSILDVITVSSCPSSAALSQISLVGDDSEYHQERIRMENIPLTSSPPSPSPPHL